MNVNVVDAVAGTVTFIDTLAPGGRQRLDLLMAGPVLPPVGGSLSDPKPPTGPVEADPDELDPDDEDGEDGVEGEEDDDEVDLPL